MAIRWLSRGKCATARLLMAAVATLAATPARAELLDLSSTPLFLGAGIDPNIMITIDDSGSMYRSYIPDDIGAFSAGTDVKSLAYRYNKMAYDPRTTYTLPPGPDGQALPRPTFRKQGQEPGAWDDGYRHYAFTKGGAWRVAGYSAADSCAVNLQSAYRPTWGSGDHCSGEGFHGQPAAPAFYYVYYADHPNGATKPGACTDGDLQDNDCYIRVEVARNSGINGSDERQNFANWYSYYRKRMFVAKAGIAKTIAGLGERARLGFARINADSEQRYTADGAPGVGAVVRGIRAFSDGDSSLTTDDYRSELFRYLFTTTASGSLTPLRQAVAQVGEYFRLAGTLGPWNDTPGVDDDAPSLSCRQSFNILMSDGYWNGDSVDVGNVDGGTAGYPNYTSRPPFEDSYLNTLADVALKYWATDLQPNLANDVPTRTGGIDSATWQHLVTFAVGLGVERVATAYTVDDAFQAINDKDLADTIFWPDPTVGDASTSSGSPIVADGGESVAARIDDMLHAAVNTRGGFFTASDTEGLTTALKRFLGDILGRQGSAAAVVLNSGVIASDTLVYQAKFNSSNWSGQLIAYRIAPTTTQDGTVEEGDIGSVAWKVGLLDSNEGQGSMVPLPGSNSRRIATWDPVGGDNAAGAGIPFRWSDLPESLQGLLDPEWVYAITNPPSSDPTAPDYDPHWEDWPTASDPSPLVDYLRGTSVGSDDIGRSYRPRIGDLGDIINAAPAYMGPPAAPYTVYKPEPHADTPSLSYSAFRETYSDRRGVVFIGANDGMLHAFDAVTGAEKFAYVPGALLGNLHHLADPNYAHRSYADGSPTVVDAFFKTGPKTSQWRTVLVAGLNLGGQAVYALDVTETGKLASGSDSQVTEANAGEWVLWEFTDNDQDCSSWAAGDKGDCDIGYTYSQPNVVRLNNGQWAAIFGNGYNSTEADGHVGSGEAVLYLVSIETGGLIRKISVGPRTDPLGLARPNGLATVAPVDVDNDFTVDYAYAGDLYGNLWRFDLRSTAESGWDVASQGNAAQPRFVAAAGQAITTRPLVTRHPNGLTGLFVMFGTGQYLETGDHSATDQPTQSFYGIWDDDFPNDQGWQPENTDFPITRSDLLAQSILGEAAVSGETYRLYSDTPIEWEVGNAGSHRGWYLDLAVGGVNNGERQVSGAQLRNGRVIFTTLLPVGDVCNGGGNSWVMEVDPGNGGPPPYPTFDVNRNGSFTLDDVVTVTVDGVTRTGIPGGIKSKVGIVPTPAILARRAGGREYKYVSGSSGQLDVITESPGPADSGRQSWQQLFR